MILHDFPKQSLGFFPTPLVELTRLSDILGGPTIFMKRDDQSGLALGGNKTRKLEYILGDAISKGCDALITAGAAQSNHCRQTAAAAAKLGLECHLLLGGMEPDKPSGNLLLDSLFGCHIHWTGKYRKGESIPEVFARLKGAKKRPYIVPYGGSNELGAIAFVEATKELQEQSNELSLTHIVCASSSGGTQAGLMLGKKMFEMAYHVVGINIDKDEPGMPTFKQQILSLANLTANKIGFEHKFSEQELILNSSYVGKGYGVVGDLENEAISVTAKSEGILLDPVYTGRAMGGLIHMIRSGQVSKKDRILFWHTGGTPALFAD
jgi:D-cysteine desulfhydrase